MSRKSVLEQAYDEAAAGDDENTASTLEETPLESAPEVPTEANPEQVESPPTVEDVLEAPEMWGAEYKEKFRELSPEWKQFFLERDKEMNGTFTRKTQELSGYERRYKALDEVFEPYKQTFLESGLEAPDVVKRLLQWNEAFTQDPITATDSLLRTMNLSLPEVISRLQGQQSSQVDPALQPILQEIEESRRFREELRQKEEQLKQEQELQSLTNELSKMAEEKDATGQSKRPYFSNLKTAIQGLVPQILQEQGFAEKSYREIVDEAYRRAFEPFKEVLRQQAVAQVQKSQKAMRAGSTLGQSSETSGSTRSAKGTRAILEQVMEELT